MLSRHEPEACLASRAALPPHNSPMAITRECCQDKTRCSLHLLLAGITTLWTLIKRSIKDPPRPTRKDLSTTACAFFSSIARVASGNIYRSGTLDPRPVLTDVQTLLLEEPKLSKQ